MMKPGRALLAILLAVSVLSAKKTHPQLNWKTGILWESPDACIDNAVVWKETFLILSEDTLYHVAHSVVLSRKLNVTEGQPVKYAVAQGDFYLQDEDERVFKLAVLKKELDPAAREKFKSGKQPCQP